MNQKETENWNSLITRSEIEFIIQKQKQKLPVNKSSGPDTFTGVFYQTYEELIPILFKLFQKNEEGILTN